MARYNEERETHRALDRCYENAHRLELDLSQERIVVLCDVHKGDKTPADDFHKNENIYCHALRHYFREGFRLVLAGDIEETWESCTNQIREAYKETAFQEERAFAESEGRYFRVHGNHDLDLGDFEKLTNFLRPLVGAAPVHPALVINDQILIVHGHQGDPHSDLRSKLARWVVKYIWAPLERRNCTLPARIAASVFGIDCAKRAAEDPGKQQKRDLFLYRWAAQHQKLLIAGHTHAARFCSRSKVELQHDLYEAMSQRQKGDAGDHDYYLRRASVEYLGQELEQIKANRHRAYLASEPEKLPCYFNAGSCVFTNGITGIELDHGDINLVKWEVTDTIYQRNIGLTRVPEYFVSIERKVYQTAALSTILRQIQSSAMAV